VLDAIGFLPVITVIELNKTIAAKCQVPIQRGFPASASLAIDIAENHSIANKAKLGIAVIMPSAKPNRTAKAIRPIFLLNSFSMLFPFDNSRDIASIYKQLVYANSGYAYCRALGGISRTLARPNTLPEGGWWLNHAPPSPMV
jgi:hypothetical protein